MIERLNDYELGRLDHEETVALFQELLDTGMIYHLQGFYGRTANQLLATGEIHLPPR